MVSGSNVLNNNFKGHLFKSLASVYIPAVPHNMEAVSKSKEFAFYTSSLRSAGGNIPLLHYEIKLVLERRHISASTQEKQGRMLADFSNKLTFCDMGPSELAAAQAPPFPNKTVTFRASDNTSIEMEVPFTHIYADESVKVKSYTLALSLLSPITDRTFVYGKNGLPMFTQRTPIFAQKNFLLPILTDKLLLLECSGIFGKWDKSSQAVMISFYVDYGIELVANYGISVQHKHRVSLPLIYEDMNPPKDENTAKALPISFMTGPVQGLVVGLVVSLVSCVFELIRGWMRWRKVRVRRLSKSWVVQ